MQESPSGSGGQSAPNSLTASERSDGWRLLFDGTSTAGWRGYKATSVPSGWQASGGSLTRVGGGGDIITTEKFRDFDLMLEWKVGPGGNSGVMYRVTEDNEATYHSGPEMQVLDDAAHHDGKEPLTSAGALYGLYAAPRGIVKPAGQWNQARVVVKGNHVEHWLNGVKVVDAEMWGPDWDKRHKASKFVEWPPYARAREGHIALQDHGDRVEFRNIKIKVL